MNTQVSEAAVADHHHGNGDDVDYTAFLIQLNARFLANTQGGTAPLFKTNVSPDQLWAAYMHSLPEGQRQFHTCSCCRGFIKRYGGLVTIAADGSTASAIWNPEDAPPLYLEAVKHMQGMAQRASVTGPFLSALAEWGQHQTGIWQHLSITPPASMVYTGTVKTAGQAMATKREDFGTVRRALDEITPHVLEQALTLLRADALYRSEKVLGQAEWLHTLQCTLATTPHEVRAANILWRAVATAPAGFCHPRSSMIGTLLEDIAAGLSFTAVSARFASKMDPLRYQRAVAGPTPAQIEAAERAVEALGIAPAFARRFATLTDFDVPGAVLWQPSEHSEMAPGEPVSKAGFFSHLKQTVAAEPQLEIPPKTVTWEKFARDVLPGAARIEYRVPLVGRFCALTAALDPAAPMILQWDSPEERNTVSWCFPSQAARADEWGLQPPALATVSRIVKSPNLWQAGDTFGAHGRGVFLLLDGARDTRGLPGGGLFNEHLRNELAPYRSTIEAHLNRMVVVGADDPATAGFGIGLLAGNDWSEVAAPKLLTGGPSSGAAPARIHVILVVDDSGSMAQYIQAARSALSSMLGAVRAMPGQVDVTFILFGNTARVLADRVPLAALEGMEQHMRGASGNTALNDTIIEATMRAFTWPDAGLADTSFFLGIVTDGEENHSTHGIDQVAERLAQVNATGRWTVAYAGAGRAPRSYAQRVGIPPGNITEFEASARGFDELGARYSSSTRSLATAYAGGARSSTSFFGAASGSKAIGKDLPVLVVTHKSGTKATYQLDRWD